MTRTRASKASAAFARVGIAQVDEPPADLEAGEDGGISASENAGVSAVVIDGPGAGGIASTTASGDEGRVAGKHRGGNAGQSGSRKAGKRQRRVGRPRGPDRVALTIRILTVTDERLTEAVETTGQSPQYIVDAALATYLDSLGIPESPARA